MFKEKKEVRNASKKKKKNEKRAKEMVWESE